ncbi:DNA methyltransferase [Maribellus mangrovi]|uniref:DNA methyltransferase n=1 Tax=Maribellus mangrovi TaxID=3133146 RepID=UPI0030EC3D16
MIVDIKKLKINPIHSKLYLTNDIDDLAESIKETGQLEKIVVNNDYVIISGVRRYLALKKLNRTEADVEIKNINQGDTVTLISFNKQRVKTTRELLNEADYLKSIWGQKRGRKSANSTPSTQKANTRSKITKKLGISAGNLVKLEKIKSISPELLDEIDNGVVSINQAHNSVVKFEKQKKQTTEQIILPSTISKNHYTIYNSSSDKLDELEDESIQLCFTSPPYWDLRIYSGDKNELGAEKTSDEYVQRVVNHLHACWRVLKPRGSFFLNIGDTFHKKRLQNIPHRVVLELINKGWILRNSIVWHKVNRLPSNSKDNLTSSYEFIFHLTKQESYDYNPVLAPKKNTVNNVSIINQKTRNNGLNISHVSIPGSTNGKQLTDFWTEDVVTTAVANQSIVKKYGGTDHPAPFVQEVVLLPLLQTTKPGDLVLDPFSGSATTGAVALMCGRKYVGYDFNPAHNMMQEKRLDEAVRFYNRNNRMKQLSQSNSVISINQNKRAA